MVEAGNAMIVEDVVIETCALQPDDNAATVKVTIANLAFLHK